LRIERIEWLDASSNTGWDSRSSYEKTFDIDLMVTSVGHVVHETEDRVVLLQTYSSDNLLYDVSLVLPKSCIVRRTPLTEDLEVPCRQVAS